MAEDLPGEIEALLAEQPGVHLATWSDAHGPECSHAPCLVHEQCVHVLLSGLASHTANLLATPEAGLMWIEDAAGCANPFARRRLTLRCRAQVVERGDTRHALLLETMALRLGPTVNVLRGLPDFVLFALRPVEGRYIRGFGAAYRFEGLDLSTLTPVRGG